MERLRRRPRGSSADGTLPGDAGFDPLGLSVSTQYLQFDIDQLDQSSAVNKAGNVIGTLKKVDNKPTSRTIVVSCSSFFTLFLSRGSHTNFPRGEVKKKKKRDRSNFLFPVIWL